MADGRAIVFDLDDTLYPYRDFVLSGFRVVAARMAHEHGVGAGALFDMLQRARQRGHRGRELQLLCRRLGLPMTDARRMASLIRGHVPSLRLPAVTRAALVRLRPEWRIGVLTNGVPRIQARKVEALGLARFVDAVVYAARCGGEGALKPDPRGFHAVLCRLGARAASSVFVGDDPRTDMLGAALVGMKTIRIARGREAGVPRRLYGDARVRSIAAVPGVAARLVHRGRKARHVV